MTRTNRIITLAVVGAAVGVASSLGYFTIAVVMACLCASALTIADYKAGKFDV